MRQNGVPMLAKFACLLLPIASSTLVAQTTSYSGVVGFVKVTINGTSGSSGSNFVGPGLVEKELFRGALVAQVPAANTLQAATAVWATNEFDTNASANSHYVEIVSSTNPNAVGLYTDIVSHTADTLTTADNISPVLQGGETIVIRRHKTVASIFGPANEAGLGQGASSESDTISVLTPGNSASFSSFYYRSGGGLGGTGWRSIANPFVDESDRPLKIGEGLLIQRKQGTPIDIVIDGYVHEGPLQIPLKTGYNLVDPVAPITDQSASVPTPGPKFTLGGLVSGSVIPSGLATPLVSGSPTSADVVSIFDGVQSFSSYYQRGTGLLGGSGWRSFGDPFFNTEATVVPPLTSLLFEIRSGNSNWVRPQSFNLP